jgi:large subunit ribosomal protein L9
LTFVLETGETGKAFGAVTAKDIAERVLAEAGQEVDRHRIDLPRPIKESGDFTVSVRLHPEVEASLKLSVTAKNVSPASGDAEEQDKPKGRRAPKKSAADEVA